MASEGIRIEVQDAALTAALERLAQADMTRANDAIGAAIVASTKMRFERQAGPDGKPWQRLSPRTAAKRIGSRRRGFDNILRVSGRLSNSITHIASAEEIAVGTNLPYAGIHQLGGTIQREARQAKVYHTYNEKTGDIRGFTKRSRANLERDVTIGAHTITIPARPYLGIDEADRAEIAATYEAVYRTAFEGGTP